MRHACWLILVMVPCLRAVELECVENREMRVCVNRQLGGSITWVGKPGGLNLINSADYGRQVQQSYYGGPKPYGEAHKNWKDWSWNPISTGDVYGFASELLALENDGKELHTRVRPKQWALKNVACECTFDTWIRLEGAKARVRARLTNEREDTKDYGVFDQEVPAVYTNGPWHHLWTFDAKTGALREVQNQGPPWVYWDNPEGWAALVDEAGWGLGVIHRGATRFVGGFHGKRGAGGEKDGATGYMSPLVRKSLPGKGTFGYEYTLVLGTVEEIRKEAVK